MVTLNKPGDGSTSWTTAVNDNWTTIENELIEKSTFLAKGDILAASAASTPARLAAGSKGQVLVADSAQSSGVKWSSITAGTYKAIFAEGRGQIGGYGVGTVLIAGWGLFSSVGYVQGSNSKGVDSSGQFAQMNTSGSANNTGYAHSIIAVTRRDVSPIFIAKCAITSTTSIRFFAGWTSTDGETMLSSDDPAAHYVGVQFSTNRSDANWQFVSKDGTTQNLVNTGIPVGTDAIQLRITVDNTVPNIKVELLNSAFEPTASTTFTTNLPGSTTELRMVVGVGGIGVGRGAKHYHAYAMNRV
jgi:hypothetical protein